MVKVNINKDLCIACGVCWALVPEVFELDPPTGKTRIKPPYATSDSQSVSEGEIPNEMLDSVKNAASSCPTTAITVG